MPPNKLITAIVTTDARDADNTRLAANHTWRFTTGPTPDTTPPTVTRTSPEDGATGVAINKRVAAVFSEAMDPETINESTFTLEGGGGMVAGTVTLLNNVATFRPTANLKTSTLYKATVTVGVHDLSDNAMAANMVWQFTTGTNPDVTSPRIVSTDPAEGEIDVPVNKSVSATFSDDMDPSTLTPQSFTLRNSDGAFMESTVTYSNRVATLNPVRPLAANQRFTARVSVAARDSSGNAMADPKAWSFTTAANSDATRPTVTSTNPADNATNFFLNKSINATFSEAMNANTINNSTFTIAGVAGTVSYDTSTHIGTFNPIADLAPNTTYTATISKGARDAAGNAMANAFSWSFTTGVQRAQTNIDLGAASSYAVLAGSTVTNAGPTVLNGDLGVSPGTAITGFPPGKVNGNTHAGDAQAAQAKADLLKGQLEAAGLLGGQALPGDLSGLTFTPGLYKNSTSVMLSSGQVTLDAQGDSDAVFIFQMGSTLTTSPGTRVVLAGGAKASNIYWSVGTSATLGVNSFFKGVILAEVSITVNSGARHDGTLLTKTGAVTLDANTVTRSLRNRP
jgi:hypothetical protein